MSVREKISLQLCEGKKQSKGVIKRIDEGEFLFLPWKCSRYGAN